MELCVELPESEGLAVVVEGGLELGVAVYRGLYVCVGGGVPVGEGRDVDVCVRAGVPLREGGGVDVRDGLWLDVSDGWGDEEEETEVETVGLDVRLNRCVVV